MYGFIIILILAKIDKLSIMYRSEHSDINLNLLIH